MLSIIFFGILIVLGIVLVIGVIVAPFIMIAKKPVVCPECERKVKLYSNSTKCPNCKTKLYKHASGEYMVKS